MREVLEFGCTDWSRTASIGGMLDAALLRLAGRQHGLVTSRQLVTLGFSKDGIFRRLKAGTLFRVYRGVYAVAGTKDTFEFRAMAAVLAAGEGAVASGSCAAALYGMRRIRCDAVEVTVSGRHAPRHPGFVALRRDHLGPADRSRIGVIPVTSPGRTLLELAPILDPIRLGGALDDVIVRRISSLAAIERLLTRTADEGRPGAGVLGRLVAERLAGKKPSATGLEDELRRGADAA